MRIVKIDQNTDEWLEFRLGKITGSKAKSVIPLSRGADRTPQGFWIMLAEKIAMKSDGEKDIDRGHRLENEAIDRLSEVTGLPFEKDAGMWLSDIDDDIAISPDGAQPATDQLPTYAAEAKCLSSANHLKYVIKDRLARSKDGYQAINSIPNEHTSQYREQIIQYFVVNEALQTLYFILFDDRIGVDSLVFHIIEIKRGEIEDLVEAQKQQQIETLKELNKLISELVGV